jgi:hypothetical protein
LDTINADAMVAEEAKPTLRAQDRPGGRGLRRPWMRRVLRTGSGMRLALTHAAALAGALAAYGLGAPLPFMIGALVAIAALGLAGVRTATHRLCRNGGLAVLMTGIGLGFTPAAAAEAADQLPLILAAAALTVALGCAIAPLLSTLAGIDRRTAFFCAVPGGPAEMSLMGERHGADAAPVAISQLLRIVALVLVLPPALTAAGVAGAGSTAAPGPAETHLAGLFVTIALSLYLGFFLRWLGLSTGFLFGPMLVGLGFGLTGAAPSAVPQSLMQAAQVVMGAYLGAQFQPEIVRAIRRFLPAAALSVALLAGSCAALGVALHWINGASIPTMLLATAPGSVTEMSITAAALGLDTALVTAFHLPRIVLVLLLVAPTFAGMRRLGLLERGASNAPEPPDPADAAPDARTGGVKAA